VFTELAIRSDVHVIGISIVFISEILAKLAKIRDGKEK